MIKNYFKKIFKKWFLEAYEEELKEIKSKYDNMLKHYDHICKEARCVKEEYNRYIELVENCHKLINSICDVGTDVGYTRSEHSWAVICVHGQRDYVKFVDMSQDDIRSINTFLKQFQYSNRVTDSPLAKGMMEDMLVRNWWQ